MGCVETVYKTEIQYQYVRPEIPEAIISQCDPLPTTSIYTNGDLLMSYISLQSSYSICASKINSIRMILQTYDEIYSSENSEVKINPLEDTQSE